MPLVITIGGGKGRITMEENKEPGMYAAANPSYPQVKVGNFIICRQDETSVWIQLDSGEGGQFSDEVFSLAIDTFFRSHF